MIACVDVQQTQCGGTEGILREGCVGSRYATNFFEWKARHLGEGVIGVVDVVVCWSFVFAFVVTLRCATKCLWVVRY